VESSLWKRPTAWLPVAMSFSALAVVLIHVARYGGGREADEGAAAHIWQMLMAGQVPVVLFFALKWLPELPKQALLVLLVQIGAGVAALAPVYFLGL
jgi:hypothetical protein